MQVMKCNLYGALACCVQMVIWLNPGWGNIFTAYSFMYVTLLLLSWERNNLHVQILLDHNLEASHHYLFLTVHL
jgi:hypothetical protein